MLQKESTDLKVRNYALKFVQKNDPLCRVEDNVIYCEKLFVVSSTMRWMMEQLSKKVITSEQAKVYQQYLEKFLKGKVNIYWENNEIMIENIKQKATNE